MISVLVIAPWQGDTSRSSNYSAGRYLQGGRIQAGRAGAVVDGPAARGGDPEGPHWELGTPFQLSQQELRPSQEHLHSELAVTPLGKQEAPC